MHSSQRFARKPSSAIPPYLRAIFAKTGYHRQPAWASAGANQNNAEHSGGGKPLVSASGILGEYAQWAKTLSKKCKRTADFKVFFFLKYCLFFVVTNLDNCLETTEPGKRHIWRQNKSGSKKNDKSINHIYLVISFNLVPQGVITFWGRQSTMSLTF